MMKWLSIFLQSLVSALQSRGDLAFENLLLRQQLAVMKRSCSRPPLSKPDRLFWICASRVLSNWRGRVAYRQARNRCSLAQAKFPGILDSKIPKEGAASVRHGHSSVNSEDAPACHLT